MYTDAHINMIKRELKDMIYFFGYAKSSLDTEPNPTGFFEYDVTTDLE